jgi:tape measure domain-containing protein
MAEYRLEFEADSGAAQRSIFNLKKSIKEVTKEFEKSEIGAEDFIETASNLSRLKKELGDARSAVANIDKAYRDLNKAVEATFAVHTKATNEASKYHKNLLQIAEDSFRAEDKLRDKNFRAEQDDWDRRLKIAVAAKNKIAAQEKAIMDFRAGMGARGAIPAIASPIRGGISFPDSPDYKKAMADAAARAARQASASGGVQIPATLRFQPFSLAYYEDKLRKLKNEARLISPDSDRWRALNKEILKAERGLNNIQKRQKLGPTGGQRLGAAGGAFLYGGGLGGGVGSALGGVAGGLAGGVPGAFAGAAGGQVLDNLIQQAGAVAKLSAEYNKSRMALAGVTSDQEDFNKAISAASDIGQKFLLPLVDSTKQFTKLQASVRGAGYDTETTVKAFNGIASAIIATGGSTEDLNGALLATSQVFSKGKVSAEELRQQIGERLAGAFTIFADSSGIAAKELDKLLQKGEVTLDDFIKFLDELGKRYGSTADLLATAPENAGPRLQVAIQAMQLTYAGFFQKVGAGFQAYATDLVNFTITNQKQFQEIIATVAVMAQDIYNIFSGLIDSLIPPLTSFFKFIFENFARGIDALSSLAEQSKRAAGGPEQRAAAAVEALYPNLIDRALKGGKAYQEALAVELRLEAGAGGGRKSLQDRINEMSKNLFAPYQPSKFGAALSKKPASGAGMDGADGADGAAANSKLKEFFNDRVAVLQARLRAEKDAIDAQLLLSDKERQIEKARLDFKYGNLIVDEQLLEAQRRALDFQTSSRGRFIAEQEKLGQIEKQSLASRLVVGVAGDLNSEYQRLLGTYEDLEIEAASLAAGIDEVTESQKAAILVNKIRDGLQVEELAMVDDLAAAYISQAKAVDLLTENIKKQQAFSASKKTLKDQLALAGILDPRVELRARLQQENPKLELGQVEELAVLQERIEAATKARDQLRSIASSIGDAFGTAFKGIITGTSSVREAFAGMFQSIADSFADMVAQMISEWLKTQLLQGFQSLFGPALGALGGGFSGGAAGFGGGFNAGIAPLSGASNFSSAFKFANGGIAAGGFRAFANGGVVTGPTLGLVGEGRYNEAVIPLPDGKSVPVDLGGGAGSQITSNIVVNVSSDGKTSSSGADSVGLGRKIEGAVKQVIVEELRPGGVLAGRR